VSERKSPQVMIVTSLPADGSGQKLKDALAELAKENCRSVSNQTYLILRDHLVRKGLLK